MSRSSRLKLAISSATARSIPTERSLLAGLITAVLPFVCLLGALVLTWVLAGRPWSIQATLGRADSAVLGPGFYTGEVTAEGVPFRWTNGPATFRVPYLRSSYLVSFRADTATGEPYTVKLLDNQRRWATFEAQPGFRTYHVLWRSPVAYHGLAGLGARDFTVLAEARPLREGDDRLYGIAISEFAARDLAVDAAPIAPLLAVGLCLGALGWLLRPLRGRMLLVFVGAAFALPLLFNMLAWNPPPGATTWLPLAWLPWFLALALTGTALARTAERSRNGAFVACGMVAGVITATLVLINLHWRVEGPDYFWHLNHGGSWDRVFRAHRFYPFGFPLVLYLGQLAGDRPLLFGRLAGLAATLAIAGATFALAWRVLGRNVAWLAGAVLLGAPIVLAYGVLASTDAPLAACAALALLALCWHERPGWQQAALGGLALGCGYLFRFQAIMLLVPAVLWLLFQPAGDIPARLGWLRRTGRFALPIVVVGAFVLATAPQWILDIRDFGRPYFTQQYVNIWLFAFNKQDGLPEGSPAAQVWYILSYDPSALWRHWVGNVRQAGMETLHAALIWPFGVLALAGGAMGLLSTRDRRFALLALWIAIYVAAVALTYNKERFFLPVMPALVVCALVPLRQLAERMHGTGRMHHVVVTAAGAAVWCWALLHLLDAERELVLYALR